MSVTPTAAPPFVYRATCDDCDQPAVCWGPVIMAACDFRLCADCARALRAAEAAERNGDDSGAWQPLYAFADDGSRTREPYQG